MMRLAISDDVLAHCGGQVEVFIIGLRAASDW